MILAVSIAQILKLMFEILNMTSTLDDPNDQFAISDDDVFLLNEEEDEDEDELSLQTDEK